MAEATEAAKASDETSDYQSSDPQADFERFKDALRKIVGQGSAQGNEAGSDNTPFTNTNATPAQDALSQNRTAQVTPKKEDQASKR